MSGTFKTFLSTRGIKVKIEVDETDTRELTFYPVSVGRLISLADVAKAALGALNTLEANRKAYDFVRTETRIGDTVETVIAPAPIATMEYRDKVAREATDGLVNSLLHPENVEIVAGIVMDCLRDETLPRTPDGKHDVKRFLDGCDAGVLLQMLTLGVFPANKKLFAPLMERFEQLRASNLKTQDKAEDGKSEETTGPNRKPPPDAPSATG